MDLACGFFWVRRVPPALGLRGEFSRLMSAVDATEREKALEVAETARKVEAVQRARAGLRSEKQEVHDNRYVVAGKAARAEIMQALKSGGRMTATDIATERGKERTATLKHLKVLLADGQVKRFGDVRRYFWEVA